jgi:hypothetical protein
MGWRSKSAFGKRVRDAMSHEEPLLQSFRLRPQIRYGQQCRTGAVEEKILRAERGEIANPSPARSAHPEICKSVARAVANRRLRSPSLPVHSAPIHPC